MSKTTSNLKIKIHQILDSKLSIHIGEDGVFGTEYRVREIHKLFTQELTSLFAEMEEVVGEDIGKDFGFGYITINGKKRLADEEIAVWLNDLIAEQRTKLQKLKEKYIR